MKRILTNSLRRGDWFLQDGLCARFIDMTAYDDNTQILYYSLERKLDGVEGPIIMSRAAKHGDTVAFVRRGGSQYDAKKEYIKKVSCKDSQGGGVGQESREPHRAKEPSSMA